MPLTTPPTDEEQQTLIAETLNCADDAEFLRFIASIWNLYISERALHPRLGYLYPLCAGTHWLMGKVRHRRTWQVVDRRHADSDLMKSLNIMLKGFQEEIDVILMRIKGGRAAAFGLIATGSTLPPWTTAGAIQASQTGAVGTTIGGTSAAGAAIGSTPAAVPVAVVRPIIVPEVGVTFIIEEGGFSQVVLAENADRALISVHNTSPDPIWVKWDDDAEMGGTGNRKIAPGATWGLRAPASEVPIGYLSVVGPVTGQTFIVNEGVFGDAGASDATVTYTDLSGTIETGGESQQLADIEQDRVYLSITNTGTEDLWFNVAEEATMGEPSTRIAVGETKTYSGDSAGPEDLYITGPLDGQPYSARQGTRASG